MTSFASFNLFAHNNSMDNRQINWTEEIKNTACKCTMRDKRQNHIITKPKCTKFDKISKLESNKINNSLNTLRSLLKVRLLKI